MKKRLLALVLSFSFVFSASASIFARENNKTVIENTKTKITDSKKVNAQEEKEVEIIISLKENSAVDFSSLKTEEGKKARMEETKSLRNSFKSKLDALNINYEIIFEYDFLFAGFAIRTAKKNLEQIEKSEGVESVEFSTKYSKPNVESKRMDLRDINTNRPFRSADSNNLIKLDTELQHRQNGEGMVVAVLDTGLDTTHPVLRVTDVSKAKYPTLDSIDNKKAEVGIDYGTWKNDKVIFAHNYFSNNDNVNDTGNIKHGMHVSGIAVGNPEEPEYVYKPDGTKYSQYIKGVAPEAQLIFMKVFDNDGTTYSHLYAKALEDAVKLGADSANLSLGAPNGTEKMAGKAIVKSIDFARSMGVVVAVAAGNTGHFGFKGYKPVATNPDYGTLGDVGISKYALTVASVDTTVERFKAFEVDGKGYRIGETTSPISGKDFFDKQTEKEKEYDFVVVEGNGTDSDYANLNANGKIVVIQRGGIADIDKILEAQKKGAVGVVIYNDENSGDRLPRANFGTKYPLMRVPMVYMSHDTGIKLVNATEKKIKFTSNEIVSPYAKGGMISDFSSYGYSTDGVFKPDISAPGGLIYSSVYDGQYKVENGTSMASPHVAGAVAIVRKAIREKTNMSGEEEYDLIRALLMSTADPIYDEGSTDYVSPRKQGAGLLNVKKALSTDVFALDAKEKLPKVALKNLKSSVFDFTVKVVNFGNTEKTLTYKTVLGTDAVENGYFTLKTRTLDTINGESIVVPANGEKEITISIDASRFEDELKGLMPNGYFLEGFVIFNDENDLETISIPFSGFRGDFENLPLWEKPIYEFGYENGTFKTDEKPMYFEKIDKNNVSRGVNVTNVTSLVTFDSNDYIPKSWEPNSTMEKQPKGEVSKVMVAGFEFKTKSFLKDKIAFSPNGDGNKDFLTFMGVFYRNAEYIVADVYKDGSEEPVFSSEYADYAYKSSHEAEMETASGTKFLGLDKEGNELPEGRYKYVVSANPTTNGGVQKLEFSILLDRTKPVIENPIVTEGKYTPSVQDELSGVEDTIVKVMVNDSLEDAQKNEDGSFTIPSDADLSKSMVISFDYAGNIAKLYLDGTKVEKDELEGLDLTTGIIPVLNVTNYQRISGDPIPTSEKLNMFFNENFDKAMGIMTLEDGEPVEAKLVDGKYILPPGEYMLLVEGGEYFNEIEPVEFTVTEGEFKEVVMNATVKYPEITDSGAVTVGLLINGSYDEHSQSLMSYVIKDESGETVDMEALETDYSYRYSPVFDDNEKLINVSVTKFKYYKLPVGNYTFKVTSIEEDYKLEEKEFSFTVQDGKVTPVLAFAEQIIADRVRLQFDGVDKLPEGLKVIFINKADGEKIEIPKSELSDNVFSKYIVNGDYTVKIEVPEGYEIDKNNLDITIYYGKYFETFKLTKKKASEIIVPLTVDDLTRTGKWEKVEDKWYYRDENAKDIYKKSWAKINNKWYYFDKESKMLESEWLKDGNEWYYLNADGAMASNQWKLYEGRWYWLQENGSMASNQWIKVKGEWFWAYTSGKIAENEWVYVSGKWYYAKSGGYIAINTVLNINGKKYRFDKTGALVD